MSKMSNLNKIIQHTPIDRPIRLKGWHDAVCMLFALVGLGLYYENLDDPTVEHILTDYAGVLAANFAGVYFSGRDYFKDKLEREVPVELKTILTPPSHRTALIIGGSLAAALPFGAMAWQSTSIDLFSSERANNSLEGIFSAATWLVNGFMNNIPVRELLESTGMRWLLFWFLLGPYHAIESLVNCCLKPRREGYALMTGEVKSIHSSRADIVAHIDQALNDILSLNDVQLIRLYQTIQRKNTAAVEIKADDNYFAEIINATNPQLIPALSINTPLFESEEPELAPPVCARTREKCAELLNHSFLNKLILLFGFILSVVILLADSLYVRDSGEKIAGSLGLDTLGQKICGWGTSYLAMTFAWVLARNFCTNTLQYGVDSLRDVVSPVPAKNFGARFYPKTNLVLKGLSGYLGYFSSAAGVNLYNKKITIPVLPSINLVGLKLFNTRALLGLVDDGLQVHSNHHGKESAQAASRIISFFNLLKKRVNMMKEEETPSFTR